MEHLKNYIFETKKFDVYLMVGIPGSGKSTWCEKNHSDLETVSRDKIRAELGYTSGVDEKAVLSREQEQEVTVEEYKRIDNLCSAKKSFIIDDTNTGRFRKQMIDHLHELGANVIGVNMNTPFEECVKNRKGQIPEDVMKKIWDKKEDLRKDEVDKIIVGKYTL